MTVHRDAGRRREHRRQTDHRRLGPERLREIDDRELAGVELVDELRERSTWCSRVGDAAWLRATVAQVALELISVLEQRQVGHVSRTARRPRPSRRSSSVRSRASASRTRRVNSSSVRTVAVRGTPAAAAMPAMSLPVDVAVGKPPTESRLSLSNTTCTQILRPIARERRQAAEVHQHRAVAVEHDDRAAPAGSARCRGPSTTRAPWRAADRRSSADGRSTGARPRPRP